MGCARFREREEREGGTYIGRGGGREGREGRGREGRGREVKKSESIP